MVFRQKIIKKGKYKGLTPYYRPFVKSRFEEIEKKAKNDKKNELEYYRRLSRFYGVK